MKLRIANGSLMCSTLTLGHFPMDWTLEQGDIEEFKDACRMAVEEAEHPTTTEKHYNMWADGKYEEIQILGGNAVSDFAFIIASTEPIDAFGDGDGQVESEKMMKKLGFKKMFRETTYNEKNETDINLWCIRVSDFLEAIKE